MRLGVAGKLATVLVAIIACGLVFQTIVDLQRLRSLLEVGGEASMLVPPVAHAESDELLRRFLESKAAIALGLLLLCGGVALFTGIVLLGRPLHRLAEQAERIIRGNFTPSLEIERHDEIGTLAQAMNSMAEKLADARARLDDERRTRTAALEALRHGDRIAMVDKLASGIAHQLGTPLNVVSGRAAMIASSEASESVKADARAIAKAADNMQRIIQQLLQFSRRPGLATRRSPIRALLAKAQSLVEPLAERGDVTIVLHEGDPKADVDVGKLLQAFTNLMITGIDAMPEGGTLSLRAQRENVAEPPEKRARPGDYVRVTIEDEGSGASFDDLESVFEPFFSSEAGENNCGLRLAVSHGIVRQHGGWIEVHGEAGRGTRFDVYLPEEYA